MINKIKIIQPDDWHVHLRENEMLRNIVKFTSRINKRCIAMPNTKIPITNTKLALEYYNNIKENSINSNFEPLIPCYLTENLNLTDFRFGLKNNSFVGAKLYPMNATTNSKYGISDIKNVYSAFEILEEEQKTLLIHGEKINENIDIFDREKYFIDEDLVKIRSDFPNLKIVLEHVSTSYGINFVQTNNNIAGTITPHHMLLTKNDVFQNSSINPHHFCMPIAKTEKDLIDIRKAACQNNTKFFLGTDSAPHDINQKKSKISSLPGIFSAFCSLELYANIFDEEDCLENLEIFSSINGPKFYNLPINNTHITMIRDEWIVPEFTQYKNTKIKNFYAGKKLKWKIKN